MKNEQMTPAQQLQILFENIEFRKMAAKISEEMGVTDQQWNSNKVFYMTVIAMKYLGWM